LAKKVQIGRTRPWLRSQAADRSRNLIERKRRILRPSRLANLAEAKAERRGPKNYLLRSDMRSLSWPLRGAGSVGNEVLFMARIPPLTPAVAAKSPNGAAAKAAAIKKRPKAVQKRYRASIFPTSPGSVPTAFAQLMVQLEKMFQMPIWTIIQNPDRRSQSPWDEIGVDVFKAFQARRQLIEKDKPFALLIDSPGGDAHSAYRIARMLQRRTNRLTVIVPQFAKSAATLLALGAKDLVLSVDAELGPLDVQMFDYERESYGSALDAVQALERLNAFALSAVDQSMMLYMQRTGRKSDVLLPHVLTYSVNFLRPLLEKIDTVEYTRKSRELKVAEEYAVRLMKYNYPFITARRIALQLVQRYPTHGFVIDRHEARNYQAATPEETFGLGLNVVAVSEKAETLFAKLTPFLDSQTIIGRIQEAV
jgi:hypothetical protein